MTPADFYKLHPNPGVEREAAVVNEVLAGNVPSWCKDVWVEIEPGVQVTPDYLAIGTDQDFCRCPLTPFAAQYLAAHFGAKLPTQALVDMIWKKAQPKLNPRPQNWYLHEATMRLGPNYVLFNHIIDQTPKLPCLLAGHKKDVVSDVDGFKKRPKHVAIYGWHQLTTGKPIQPLTTVHDWMYEDYSHGIRFVKAADPNLAGPASLDKAPPDFLKLIKG